MRGRCQEPNLAAPWVAAPDSRAADRSPPLPNDSAAPTGSPGAPTSRRSSSSASSCPTTLPLEHSPRPRRPAPTLLAPPSKSTSRSRLHNPARSRSPTPSPEPSPPVSPPLRPWSISLAPGAAHSQTTLLLGAELRYQGPPGSRQQPSPTSGHLTRAERSPPIASEGHACPVV